ncbi:MAG: hypothetical protein HF312_19390 [Ignavibacteria bacterium]|jgi:hypothetical protein|nr:hypothetical protein [Ignavibacteria bacterium]
MKFISIFELENQSLFAVKYNGDPENIFTTLFDRWQDIEYLEEFFNKNLDDLTRGFYRNFSVEEALFRTRQDAKELEKQFLKIKNGEPDAKSVNSFFRPLVNAAYKAADLQKTKAYGVLERSWIRLYAIKVSDNCFIVTGGAIKLTHRMEERTHTQEELDKLDRCRDFLRSHGIFDYEGLKDI